MVCLFAVYSRALANPIWNGKIRVSIFSGELEYRAKADFSRMQNKAGTRIHIQKYDYDCGFSRNDNTFITH